MIDWIKDVFAWFRNHDDLGMLPGGWEMVESGATVENVAEMGNEFATAVFKSVVWNSITAGGSAIRKFFDDFPDLTRGEEHGRRTRERGVLPKGVLDLRF